MKTLGVIGNLIKNVSSAKERARIKGVEIAKLGSQPRKNFKFSGADYDIEIVSMQPMDGGVEVFARVWDANGQIGFGSDGSVDIERFRIFNPPILVVDGTKTLGTDFEGNPRLFDNYKESALEAIFATLVHTVKVKQEKFGSDKIVAGKIGNTTSTFYPDANPETTSVDGYAAYSASTSFATTHDAATGTSADDTADLYVVYDYRSGIPDYRFFRCFALFDTSAIPDTDVVSAATLSLFFDTGGAANNADSDSLSIVSSNPASNTAIATADYDQLGTTKFATDQAFSGITASQYYDFALNASGIAAISPTGVSKFGIRTALDIANSAPTGQNQRTFKGAETATTANDPKLVVEHGVAVAAVTISNLCLMGVG